MLYYFYTYPYPLRNYYNMPNYPYNMQLHHERCMNAPLQEKDEFRVMDYGPNPFMININEAAKRNNSYRTALWTGEHLQVTLMSIKVGDDIGIEIHPETDQFLRIEQGQGIVRMGKSSNNLNLERRVNDDSAIMVPAGKWHNVINTGNIPLKLYSIYAPPHHPHGTMEVTKADALIEE